MTTLLTLASTIDITLDPEVNYMTILQTLASSIDVILGHELIA